MKKNKNKREGTTNSGGKEEKGEKVTSRERGLGLLQSNEYDQDTSDEEVRSRPLLDSDFEGAVRNSRVHFASTIVAWTAKATMVFGMRQWRM